jgi:hypothetical protein
MKLLNALILNILLLGGLSLGTCNTVKAGDLPQAQKVKAISQEIRQRIVFPDELSQENIKELVKIEFKIKADKTIEITHIESNNEFLKAYVKRQFETLDLTGYEEFIDKNLQISLWFENEKY